MSKQNNSKTTELTTEEKQQQMLTEIETMQVELTKRNEDFMYTFMKTVRERNKFKGDLIELEHTMISELIAAQKEGKTAKHLYGTPTGFASQVEEMPTKKDLAPSPFWHLWIDGGLLIGGVFALIVGLTALIGDSSANTQSSGIVALIVNFIAGGFAMAILTQNQPDFDAPKKERGTMRYMLIAVVTLVVWIGIITGVSILLPAQLNPVLPSFYYVAIGAVALAARWWFKKEYNVKNTMF